MINTKICAMCKYFDAGLAFEAKSGSCRRHAPVVLAHDVVPGKRAVWPVVRKDDWCGEHSYELGVLPRRVVVHWRVQVTLEVDSVVVVGIFVTAGGVKDSRVETATAVRESPHTKQKLAASVRAQITAGKYKIVHEQNPGVLESPGMTPGWNMQP